MSECRYHCHLLQHSVGAQQPSEELPTNAILPYLSFTFCLIISSFTSNVYKRNYLSCQEKLGKVSVIMETNGFTKRQKLYR